MYSKHRFWFKNVEFAVNHTVQLGSTKCQAELAIVKLPSGNSSTGTLFVK